MCAVITVGEWCIRNSRTLQLGRGPVKCQLVVEDNLWIACGHYVHVLEIDSLKMRVSQDIVLWVRISMMPGQFGLSCGSELA